jgi:hypothetical protein
MRMELNPYAQFLAGRNPLDIVGTTHDELAKLAHRMPQEQLAMRTPAGKWNAREIVAHLADCELAFSFRLRQTLAEDHPYPSGQDHSFRGVLKMID